MKTFKKGLVIGKFYPPHRGHKYLIDSALAQCDEVTVIICSKSGESIPGFLRVQWLRQIHPTARVLHARDVSLGDDDSAGWARYTVNLLGKAPDAVFTSEEYGDPYAKHMGCVHVAVDKKRVTVPISATLVRQDPWRYAQYLEPMVRAYFAKRICVVGAESTGTTTLSRSLAEHYHTVWVPEYGRFYSEGKLYAGPEGAWRSEEFDAIARGQTALERELAGSAYRYVIADTDAFATSIWHERYMGMRSAAVEALAQDAPHDLYILTGDEIPFEQDGLRDGEHVRHWMHDRFLERLEETGKKYVLVRGSKEERLAQAVAAIEALRK